MSIFANFDFDSEDDNSEPQQEIVTLLPSTLKAELEKNLDNAESPVVVVPSSTLTPSTIETSSSMDTEKPKKRIVVGKDSAEKKSSVKKSLKNGKVSPVKKTITKKPKNSPALSSRGRGQSRNTETDGIGQKTSSPQSEETPATASPQGPVSSIVNNLSDPVKQAKIEILYRLFSSF